MHAVLAACRRRLERRGWEGPVLDGDIVRVCDEWTQVSEYLLGTHIRKCVNGPNAHLEALLGLATITLRVLVRNLLVNPAPPVCELVLLDRATTVITIPYFTCRNGSKFTVFFFRSTKYM